MHTSKVDLETIEINQRLQTFFGFKGPWNNFP
jgi:hypothetical protein